MHFSTHGLQKTWLDKSVKNRVSEDPSPSNMVHGLKDCSKLNSHTFPIFIAPFEQNAGFKSLSELYTKS